MIFCFNLSKTKLLLYLLEFIAVCCVCFLILFALIPPLKDNAVKDYCDDNFCVDNWQTTNIIEKEIYAKEILAKYERKKVIALTFDDGPSKHTEKLLDILKEKEVRATFFVLGYKARNKLDVLKRTHEEGHDVGIHGYSHALFTKISLEKVNEEIEKSRDIVENIIQDKVSIIRVPYGILNDNILEIIENHEMTNILWNIDSKDWRLRNKNKIANKVIKNAGNGKIILMHDTYLFSVNSIETIIDKLKEEDYYFVTISELLVLNHLKGS